jgi:Fic family protein
VVVNRAGDTFFVAPDQVRATLRRGLEYLPSLEHPFARAVYMMFMVSEIHPFDDGNGRVARALMNAELVAGGQRRILVPTAFRDDYVGGLRRLSRNDDASVIIEALDRAQRFTAAIDFRDFAAAERTLRQCGAFESGRDARLRMPPTAPSP